MNNKQYKEFQEGQQMFLDGVKYNAKEMITASHHNGWVTQERLTRSGYTLKHWNKNGNVVSY